jgi:hypothetical protein
MKQLELAGERLHKTRRSAASDASTCSHDRIRHETRDDARCVACRAPMVMRRGEWKPKGGT